MVSEYLEPEKRRFRVYGTGDTIDSPDVNHYVGTWNEGSFVWHLFELLEVE